jgi:hypothetical protein
MGVEVTGEEIDPFAQQGDLDLGRTGVLGLEPVVPDDLGL